MRGAFAILLAAALVGAGCIGGGSDAGPSADDPAANATNASEGPGNGTPNVSAANRSTFAGYSTLGNATVEVNRSSEIEFTVPATGYVELVLEADDEMAITERTYEDGDGEHPAGSYGAVLVPGNATAARDPCGSAMDGTSWWTEALGDARGDWELAPGSNLLLAWGNGGNLTFRFENTTDDPPDPRVVDAASSDVDVNVTEADVETSGTASWEASFETDVRPADWTLLQFEVDQSLAAGSVSAESTVSAASGPDCRSASTSGDANLFFGTDVTVPFGLAGAADDLEWTGSASYQAAPPVFGGPSASATALTLDVPRPPGNATA